MNPSAASSPPVDERAGQPPLGRLGLVADRPTAVRRRRTGPGAPGRAGRVRPRSSACGVLGRQQVDDDPVRARAARTAVSDGRQYVDSRPRRPRRDEELEPVVGHRIGRRGQAVEAGGHEDPPAVGRGRGWPDRGRPTPRPNSGATPAAPAPSRPTSAAVAASARSSSSPRTPSTAVRVRRVGPAPAPGPARPARRHAGRPARRRRSPAARPGAHPRPFPPRGQQEQSGGRGTEAHRSGRPGARRRPAGRGPPAAGGAAAVSARARAPARRSRQGLRPAAPRGWPRPAARPGSPPAGPPASS